MNESERESESERDRETEEGNTEPSLSRLLRSCASISARALSCHTLNNLPKARETNEYNIESLLQREKETQKWLDRQILDYRARLKVIHRRRRRRSTNITSTDKDDLPRRRPSRQELRHDLFDETVRSQQENMLWMRFQMASQANRAVFSPFQQNEPHSLLIQEAITSRDEQVRVVQDKQRQIEKLRQNIEDVSRQFLNVQGRNRELWQEIHSKPGSAEITTAATGTQTERFVLATETTILKRVVQDILLGSGLDWYSDGRLRGLMMKLE